MSGDIGFYLFTFLLLGDDNVAGISTDIDDRMEIANGRVMEIATSLLIHIVRKAPMFGTFYVGGLAGILRVFSLGILRSFGRHGYVKAFIDVIQEVVIVVNQLDTFQSLTIYAGTNHEDLVVRSETFGALLVVAFSLVVRQSEGFPFLKWEFVELGRESRQIIDEIG